MLFADVNLSKDRVTAAHGTDFQPGAGGWPTHRYFNKETGLAGQKYVQKIPGAKICDELGDQGRMMAYVLEAGKTALCSVETGNGCSDKEKEFTAKWTDKGGEAAQAELARLTKMQAGGAMKPELKAWLDQRVAILRQLAKNKDEL